MIKILEDVNLKTLNEDESVIDEFEEIKEELNENLDSLADIFMRVVDTVGTLQKMGMKSLDDIKLPTTLISQTEDLLVGFVSENPTKEDVDKLNKSTDEIIKFMGDYLK